ncbi:MFS general substrate transporter [Thozetella sp. PMI_491]|nr:MFS general substrate transporter [Thozetella sp. PMI_491]
MHEQQRASAPEDPMIDGENPHQQSQNCSEVENNIQIDLPWQYYLTPKFVGSYFALVLMACNLYVSYTIPISLLQIINAEIGPDSNISLVPLLHTLLKGVGLLLIGRLTDIFGRRWFLIGGQILCGVGSIPCAMSQNVGVLIGGTVILAIGGSVQPLYPLYCQEIVPNKYRPLSQAFLTLCILPFFGFGPVIGRLLVQNTALGWRASYWINATFCFASALLFFFCYFPPSFSQLNPEISKGRQLAELDFVGIVLYAGGAILLLLGFDAVVGGWNSSRVIALLVVGGVALIAFAFWEVYGSTRSRLVPLHLFKMKGYWSIVAIGCVSQMTFFSFNLFLPQIAQYLFTTDNLEIGLIATTTNAGIAVGEIVTGFLWKRIRHNHIQLIAACFGLVLFSGLMALTTQDRIGVAISMAALAGFFIGWTQLVTLVSCGLVVPAHDIGIGQGFFGSCRNIIGTIATSIFVSIYGNRISQTQSQNIPPAIVGAGLPASSVPLVFQALKNGTAAALRSVPSINSTIIEAYNVALKDSYSQSFSTVYLSGIAFGSVALVASYWAPRVDMLMTNFLNKRIDGVQVPGIRERYESDKKSDSS